MTNIVGILGYRERYEHDRDQPVVLGFDPSLASFGIASRVEGRLVPLFRVLTFKKAHYGQKPTEDISKTMLWLDTKIASVIQVYRPDLVVIESPSYGSSGNIAHALAGLWWQTVNLLYAHSIPVWKVTPGQIKIWATGKGQAAKKEVTANMKARHGITERVTSDEMDALAASEMAYHVLGYPGEAEVPPECLRALDNTKWPKELG